MMARYMKVTLETTKKKVSACKLNRLTYPNDKMYKGGFKNNKPHGKGVLYQPDGSIIKAIWDMGVIIQD